jgi:hypothetical protein
MPDCPIAGNAPPGSPQRQQSEGRCDGCLHDIRREIMIRPSQASSAPLASMKAGVVVEGQWGVVDGASEPVPVRDGLPLLYLRT